MGRENNMAIWAAGLAAKYALIVLVLILWTVLVARGAQAKAERRYEAWQERWVNEYLAQQEAMKAGMPVDPYAATLDYEAQLLARVLYGVKDNSTEDLITACWCVFNRCDSPMYPEMLEDVIAQPQQWMRYSEDNPVLDNLYQIARTQLDAWHSGTTRPISSDFVYMDWSPSRITLRNQWEYGRNTETWRYGQ